MGRKKYKYEDYHKVIDEIEYKRCAYHEKYFGEEVWFPCTEEYFYKNKLNKSDGLYPECKECSKKKTIEHQLNNPKRTKESKHNWHQNNNSAARTKQWRKDNPERKQEYQSYYFKSNPDKLRIYNQNHQHKEHKITNKEWLACKNYFGNSCAYCGMHVDNHYQNFKGSLRKCDLHKEHANHFGANDLSNCVPACLSCNSHKWQFELEKWYKEYPAFTQERLNKIMKWLNEDYKKYIKIKK